MTDDKKGGKPAQNGASEPYVDDRLVQLVDSLPAPSEFAARMLEAVPQAQPLKIYLKEIGRFPVLSESEEASLVKTIQDKPDAKTRKRLNEANIRLVAWIAKEYASGDTSLSDLINEGTLGLANSVDAYDPAGGLTFRMHAAAWIRKTVSEAVAYETSLSRIPDYLLEKIESIKPVSQRLTTELKREPTREEVSSELGLSVDELDRLVKLVGHAPNNEETLEEDEEDDLLEGGEYDIDTDYD